MGGDAVELVVHFGDTLLAVTRVRRGGRYLVGTAPEVDLPVCIGSITAFPLVDSSARGFVVRLPIGVPAWRDGTPIADTVMLARGQRVDVRLGLVSIAITRVDEPPVVLPRAVASKRIVPFALGALVAHVALVVIAMLLADVDPITIPVVRAEQPTRVLTKTLPEKPPTPKQPKKPKHADKAAVASAAAPEAAEPAGTPDEQRARAAEAARGAGILGSASLDDLSAVIGTKDLAKELSDVGPLYDEDAANAKNFGGSAGRFVPEADRAFDSIKTGPYATMHGKMGEHYRLPAHGKFREVERPPIMGLTCDDGSCTTSGSLDRFAVRDYVEKRYVDMVSCFQRHARNAPRIELTLRFEIDSDGKPTEVHADGETGFGSCVVRIVERVKFPTNKPTQVTYPIAFWRT